MIGDAAARVGRYEYLVLVLLAAAVALGIEAVVSAVRTRPGATWAVPVAAAVVLAVVVGHGLTLERRQASFGAASARLYKTWVYGGLQAADAGERQLVVDSSTGFNGGRFELFAQPELRRALPAKPASPQDRLDTESEYFAEVGATHPALFSPTRITRTDALSAHLRVKPGCYSLTTDGTAQPTLEIATGSGTEIGITSGSTLVTTQVVRTRPVPPRSWVSRPDPVSSHQGPQPRSASPSTIPQRRRLPPLR